MSKYSAICSHSIFYLCNSVIHSVHRWKSTRGSDMPGLHICPQHTHTGMHTNMHTFSLMHIHLSVKKSKVSSATGTQSALLRWGTLCIYPAGHPYFPLRTPTEIILFIDLFFPTMSFFTLGAGVGVKNKQSALWPAVSLWQDHTNSNVHYCNPIHHIWVKCLLDR